MIVADIVVFVLGFLIGFAVCALSRMGRSREVVPETTLQRAERLAGAIRGRVLLGHTTLRIARDAMLPVGMVEDITSGRLFPNARPTLEELK